MGFPSFVARAAADEPPPVDPSEVGEVPLLPPLVPLLLPPLVPLLLPPLVPLLLPVPPPLLPEPPASFAFELEPFDPQPWIPIIKSAQTKRGE